jgi:phospholipid/cholesterol/gamma-HCH transport system ATP-binding protein
MTATSDSKPIIEVSHLAKSFSNQRVLDEINLNVNRSEIMVIIGGSGCGKSTLLRHLIGSLEPDEGSVKLFGRDLTTLSRKDLDKVRKRFGILFQSGALFNSLTVSENVALILQEHTNLDSSTIEIMEY